MTEWKRIDQLGQRGSDFLGVRRPILCGAMTWVSDFQLVKAVHDCGGFGILAAGNMPADMLRRELQRCHDELEHPFAVNLITISPAFEEHLQAVLDSDVPLVVFAGNFPKRKYVQAVKDSGKRVLSFASTLSIANQMVRFGVDGLILEGSEAGGHIGHVSLTILLQQVLFEDPGVPVFVAGGIATGKMMAHLLLMGAAGIQMGTRFVMSEECTAHPALKQQFVKARAREAVETPQYDKRLPVVAVRALRNAGHDQFGALQLELLDQLNRGKIGREEAQERVERFWLGGLRKAVVEGDVEGGSSMAGQSVGLVKEIKPMAAIFEEVLGEAERELERVAGLLA